MLLIAKGTANGFIFLKDWLVITSIAVLKVCISEREREVQREALEMQNDSIG